MMKKKRSGLTVVLFIALLLLCIPAPPACAAGATSVWVNNLELTALTPYLADGAVAPSSSAPITGGYAHMNYATSTLTLNNMHLDTFHLQSYGGLVFANGDLKVSLVGANILQSTILNTGTYIGMYVQGLLTVTGSGKRDDTAEQYECFRRSTRHIQP